MFIDELNLDKPKEECGVFGAFCDDENLNHLTYLGLFALQHRGQESAGMVLSNGTRMDIKRGMGLLADVFKDGLPKLKANKSIGHVRYSTAGNSIAINTQPLKISCKEGNLAIAHNGNITNICTVRDKLLEKGVVFHSFMDSEVVVNLIAQSDKPTLEEKVAESMNEIEGAFCFVLLSDKKLIAVRDKHGFHPLCIGKLDNGWVVASESCALDAVGAEFVRDVEPGEVIVIDKINEKYKSFYFTDKRVTKAHCIFEYIYFARADSIIDKQSVYLSRVEMGRQLAKENKDILKNIDVVISIPDSGTPAAIGFGLESGIPFLEGLNKNRYVGRTFIQPTQKQRDASVKMKLNPVRSVVSGKSIAIIDDSIVRGTTSGKIINLLRNAGAKKVHVFVSSPPVVYPCYYGIDTAVRKELIAANHTLEEIRIHIGADSLAFISKEGLEKSVKSMNPNNMCYACFNASYPVIPDKVSDDERFLFAKSGYCAFNEEEE